MIWCYYNLSQDFVIFFLSFRLFGMFFPPESIKNVGIYMFHWIDHILVLNQMKKIWYPEGCDSKYGFKGFLNCLNQEMLLLNIGLSWLIVVHEIGLDIVHELIRCMSIFHNQPSFWGKQLLFRLMSTLRCIVLPKKILIKQAFIKINFKKLILFSLYLIWSFRLLQAIIFSSSLGLLITAHQSMSSGHAILLIVSALDRM